MSDARPIPPYSSQHAMQFTITKLDSRKMGGQGLKVANCERFQAHGKENRRFAHTASKATAQEFLAQRLDEHGHLERGGRPRRSYDEALERFTVEPMLCGGEAGIRTLGTRKGTTVFETAPIDRSGTSPSDTSASA
jgi:hypothetical protein